MPRASHLRRSRRFRCLPERAIAAGPGFVEPGALNRRAAAAYGATERTIADTTGAFGAFGFRPPALDNHGDVAFSATLDDFLTTGIFVGPRAVQDRVIATGDKLDGARVISLTFSEEGLNDLRQLAFIARLEDPSAPNGSRTAVFRAMPRR